MTTNKSQTEPNSSSDTNTSGESSMAVSTSNRYIIPTNLLGKEQAFKILSLAQVTGNNVLLIGPPGVAKTGLVLDFINAIHKNAKTFILETNEGTRPSEIKGHIDLQKLAEERKYILYSPIAEANAIVVNEIDKCSPANRNMLLGIMNEGKLFNGVEVKDCIYDVFIGTCNIIPEDEVKSPFWDRFLLKFQVPRVGVGDLVDYYQQGGRKFNQDIEIIIPTEEQVDNVNLPVDKVKKFFTVAHNHLSDRSLVAVPQLVKAISLIWECSIDQALVKAAHLLIGSKTAQELRQILQPKILQDIYRNIGVVTKLTDENLKEKLEEIKIQMKTARSSNEITDEQYNEIKDELRKVINEHMFFKKNKGNADSDSSTKTI